MKRKNIWIAVIIILLGIGGYFGWTFLQDRNATTVQAQAPTGDAAPATVAIRAATDAAQVSAAGNIALQAERPVVIQAEGIVASVLVDMGDTVSAGDALLTLDTADLARAVTQAQLSLDAAQASMDKLTADADPEDIASAQASLASAQENLAKVKEGATAEEIASAEATLKAAQAKYDDLVAGPSDAELVQLSANLEKATISLQQAQWNYDKISYSDSIGRSPQAAALQQATIDYNSAKAAYDIATEPASDADLQQALASIESAKDQLNTLKNKPTAAELASAEAQMASAQAQLENVLNGATAAELASAQVAIDKAQIDLDEARENFAQATVTAPMDGAVLSVNVVEGQRVTNGTAVATLGDLSKLELTVNVAEVDISKIAVGQAVEIAIDALPDRTFAGKVSAIAPSSSASQGVVNYPVTITLTDDDLSGVRGGMTAVATIFTGEATEAAWLVPTDAIRERNGNAMVMVVRNGQPSPVQVTKTGTQGEWTVVTSPDLQAGDEVLGSVTSFIQQQNGENGGFGFPPVPGSGGGNFRGGGGQRPGN